MYINSYQTIEEEFAYEKYEDEKGHRIEPGENKIILSAPHSVSQIRKQSHKIGEYRTGVIIKELYKLTKCHIAYKTKNLNDDANYDENCAYKSELINYIKKNDIKLLLDFHISSPGRDFDIDLGTGYGNNIHNRMDLLQIIKGLLKKKYKSVMVDDTFPASYQHTVSSTVSKQVGIPAFQIEINWNCINDHKKVRDCINLFEKIIKEIEAKL